MVPGLDQMSWNLAWILNFRFWIWHGRNFVQEVLIFEILYGKTSGNCHPIQSPLVHIEALSSRNEWDKSLKAIAQNGKFHPCSLFVSFECEPSPTNHLTQYTSRMAFTAWCYRDRCGEIAMCVALEISSRFHKSCKTRLILSWSCTNLSWSPDWFCGKSLTQN